MTTDYSGYITIEDYRAIQGKRGNKFNARKVQMDGHTFDSQMEARRYRTLVLMEQAGEILGLRVHVAYQLVVKGVRVCRYEADFVYFEGGREIVEDVKGHRTREYIIKRKLMKAIHGIDIREVQA